MSKIVCDHRSCTGCAACRDICPNQCISMRPDALDALYPAIDETMCVDCGLCDRTCPNHRDLKYCHPQKVWAAWSNDNEVRRTSASGGVAYELYRYWISHCGVATGVVYEREKGCYFILVEKTKDIKSTQNSKYTFSNTNGIYKIVEKKLKCGVPVLFIGVPCQISGLYGFLKKEYDNLITVDIICHGMPPAEYLEQHISNIEKRKKEYTKELYFRDPKHYTYTFTFTLKNANGREFYKKKVLTNDNFQLGYHRALIYRENCYHCKYARKERISDLTIADFSGLGHIEPCSYDKRNVSCILQNTDKGADLLSKLSDKLFMEERPEREAFEYENQLKEPSVKHKGRDVFEEEYRKNRDFEKAADHALTIEKKRTKEQRFRLAIKSLIKALFPRCFITTIKKQINKIILYGER